MPSTVKILYDQQLDTNLHRSISPFLYRPYQFLSKLCTLLRNSTKTSSGIISRLFPKTNPSHSLVVRTSRNFLGYKKSFTSSPVLSIYDPYKPTFINTDWSAEGMTWIFMPSAEDYKSTKAVAHLDSTGECLFDMDLNGAWLKPVSYGSRECTDMERKFQIFVGETAAGWWVIGSNHIYLWGCHFYWMCDCKAIEEIIEYTGNIAMIQRCTQELLGYHFTVIYQK